MKPAATPAADPKPSLVRNDVTARLAALSHPARMEILARIADLGGCSCKDVVSCLELAQSTVSQHLKVLVEAGLLKHAVDRQRSRYEVDPVTLSELSEQLTQFAQSCCRAPGTET